MAKSCTNMKYKFEVRCSYYCFTRRNSSCGNYTVGPIHIPETSSYRRNCNEFGAKEKITVAKNSTSDQIKGKFHEVKGKIKEKAGRATNNPGLAEEGQDEKVAGKIQKKVGQVEKVFDQ